MFKLDTLASHNFKNISKSLVLLNTARVIQTKFELQRIYVINIASVHKKKFRKAAMVWFGV